MLVSIIKFGKIIQNIKERNKYPKVIEEAEGWVDDIVQVNISQEELINLYALSARFSNIQATDKEIDEE